MGIRRSSGKNKKSPRPAAQAAMTRDFATRKSTRKPARDARRP